MIIAGVIGVVIGAVVTVSSQKVYAFVTKQKASVVKDVTAAVTSAVSKV